MLPQVPWHFCQYTCCGCVCLDPWALGWQTQLTHAHLAVYTPKQQVFKKVNAWACVHFCVHSEVLISIREWSMAEYTPHVLIRVCRSTRHTCLQEYAPHVSAGVRATRVCRSTRHTCLQVYAPHVSAGVRATRVCRCTRHTCLRVHRFSRRQDRQYHECIDACAKFYPKLQ